MNKMLSVLSFIFMMVFSVSALAVTQSGQSSKPAVDSQQQTDLYFFWSSDCPHCVAAHPFIEKLKAERPWLKVHSYGISDSRKNTRLFEKMAREHGKETSFVPTFFVGDKMIVGFSSADTTGAQIRDAVDAKHKK